MENRLDSVVATLQQEAEELEVHLKAKSNEVAELERALGRVRAAIGQLRGKPRKNAKPGNAKATRQPAANKADVMNAVVAILTENGCVVEDDLKALAEDRITRSGRSRMGFALRFKESLSDDRFVLTDSGYRLAKTSSEN